MIKDAPRALIVAAAGLLVWSRGGLLASDTGTGGAALEAPAEGKAPVTLTLEDAIATALSRNRSLIAARPNGGIAQAGVEVSAQRPNPDIAFQAGRDTPRDSLVLSLPLEVASKRQRRIDLSEAGVGRVQSETRQLEADIRNHVRRAYYTLAAAQELVTQAEAAQKIAERAAAAAQARFDAGQVPRLEALKGSLSVAQAENEADLARASLTAARATLQVLLAGDPREALVVSHDLATGTVPAADAALAMALQANTELRVLDGRIAEARARVDLARANRYPDPVVQGGVTYDSLPDFTWGWQAGVSVTLPILSSHRPDVLVEELTLSSLLSGREALAASVEGQVLSAASIAAAKRAAHVRYRSEILPGAEEVERMAEDSYSSGQTGQTDLILVIQFLNEVRVQTVQAGLDFQIALADLERTIGAPLP